jgi:hypothetical protein
VLKFACFGVEGVENLRHLLVSIPASRPVLVCGGALWLSSDYSVPFPPFRPQYVITNSAQSTSSSSCGRRRGRERGGRAMMGELLVGPVVVVSRGARLVAFSGRHASPRISSSVRKPSSVKSMLGSKVRYLPLPMHGFRGTYFHSCWVLVPPPSWPLKMPHLSSRCVCRRCCIEKPCKCAPREMSTWRRTSKLFKPLPRFKKLLVSESRGWAPYSWSFTRSQVLMYGFLTRQKWRQSAGPAHGHACRRPKPVVR